MLRVRVQLGDEQRRFHIDRGLATRKNLESKARWLFDLEDDEPYNIELESHDTGARPIPTNTVSGGLVSHTQVVRDSGQPTDLHPDNICLKLVPIDVLCKDKKMDKPIPQRLHQQRVEQQQQQLMMDVLCDLTHFVCTRNGMGVRSWISGQKQLLSKSESDLEPNEDAEAAVDTSPMFTDQLSGLQ
ncbi:hypothetical protein BASA50_009187 [Batrachochytrium salamandrivorans]|uniref:Uncharacterized protein n=1 Tax=Batrachochytrium salamandrivorans TaxID=1357716 RepID=A0ABQ8F4Z4_9FUNG|nr:hypothetical protein BASA62_003950 [Batrachochytrium salamandrivorans]KAH6578249.1 hypothetical protein BASA60_003707 [Batrachochytrium salamandrivorans]KAH6590724.1 hypothetical protein BASA50_009187 [Batrachochytrium salamandrivorans]KAH6601999.1 hypothetical protein BASA61_001551 [Batrachochytrium salamandrivorans]KAH9251212.1 hypothetical protein BASA81_010907 [Batrachochytrium salamandrivorans]